ncbi:hypothetical protein FNV43_RR08370 [Rhamnella rubrinervis]|uniref:Uncharacterized protein n=1 Tax=Rhamnella rubrinervis TaxID=2594499 RepID=A0A8K0MJ10_9ROSA|nr:hypothetical protein FNV43_RR08370 [Rhamnella rubrinervis]
MSNEIWLLPFFGQGHLFPTMELCKHIASRDFKTTLLIPSNLSSSIPSSLLENPLVQITEIPSASIASTGPPPHHHNHMSTAIENLLSTRPEKPDSDSARRPDCVVLDVMMSWAAEIFKKFGVPTVAFFTSGACSAAMEYAIWKAQPLDIKPGQVHLLPGLPEEMALTYSDMKQRPHGPPPGPPGSGSVFLLAHRAQVWAFTTWTTPGGPGSRKMGPPKMGGPPPWVEEVEGNTGVGCGSALPEQYWKSAGSILHDREFRTNRRSNVTEDEVIQWLDSKAHGSVLYIAFGTEVGPTTEEYAQLAEALEESTRPFIWVIQPGSGRRGPPPGQPGPPPGQPGGDEGGGYFPHGGDQHYDAMLVVKYLKVGYMVSEDLSEKIDKEEIVRGIEQLMSDEDIKRRAVARGAIFQHGFPAASMAALDAFTNLISQKPV